VVPRIKNLCTKVGIKNINYLTYEEIRGNIKVFLEDFLIKIIILAQYYQKKTISVNIVYMAAEEYLLLSEDKMNTCKGIPKKFTTCLEFPKAPFLRLIKEILNDLGVSFAVQPKAAVLIQYYVERHILYLLKGARYIMLNSHRETIFPKDIKLTKTV
jgi:histone H3/H4